MVLTAGVVVVVVGTVVVVVVEPASAQASTSNNKTGRERFIGEWMIWAGGEKGQLPAGDLPGLRISTVDRSSTAGPCTTAPSTP